MERSAEWYARTLQHTSSIRERLDNLFRRDVCESDTACFMLHTIVLVFLKNPPDFCTSAPKTRAGALAA